MSLDPMQMDTAQRIAYRAGRECGERITKARVEEAHRERCDAQGHDYENCCDAFFSVFQRCKWCGEKI